MKEKKVTPQMYKKFITKLSLKEIKMLSAAAKVEKDFSPPASVKIKDNKKYEVLGEGSFRVLQEYTLQATESGEKRIRFEVKALYSLIYSSEVPITDEIFKIFSYSNLTLHTWPYFRQFVHEMTLRMNLPPLLLDVIRVK